MEEARVSTPAPTPPPEDDVGQTCRDITSNRPPNPSECDNLIEEMWCDRDCAVVFGILVRVHESSSRQPLGASDNQVLCSSTCYFTKYHDYLQRMDAGNCAVNLDLSFLPPEPYVLQGFLPGDLPSKMGSENSSDLTRFAETICIYTEATPEDPTQGYCIDIVTQAAISSRIESKCAVGIRGDRVKVETNFSLWECPDDCVFAMSKFVKDSGCCLYSLEYPRYAMAGYPFFIKDLASACKVTEYTLGLDQPCAGALTSECGAKSVCVNDGHVDSCVCTGQHHQVQNISGRPQCVDQDECQLGVSTCHADATCINSFGSYLCQCNDGFVGDGTACAERSCGSFEGVETCTLCGDECCAADSVDPAMYGQVVNIGCRGSDIMRDMNKRIIASASRNDAETCFENMTATLSDCNGNESLAMPCALWAKHDYLCTNLSNPPKYVSDLQSTYHDALAKYQRILDRMKARPFMENCSNGTWTNWTDGDTMVNAGINSNTSAYGDRVLNCTSVPYPVPNVPTPPTVGWGSSQFWCVRNTSGAACDGSKATRIVAEEDGIGLEVQAMCQADGTYNATISCERVSCGQYTAPIDGVVDGQWEGPPQPVTPRDMYFPESVVIACNSGYDLHYDGVPFRSESALSVQCQADSSYSVTEERLVCVPMSCGVYSNFITRTASFRLYEEDSLTNGTDICNGQDAEFCQQQCCDCLSRLRDCFGVGCPECNMCSRCTVLATTCSGMCPNQAVLPPQIVNAGRQYALGHDFNLSYNMGQRVTLTCTSGYELAQVLKDEDNKQIGEAQPECVVSEGNVKFQDAMSCLAKGCTPLSVENGAVMPNTAFCNAQFANCVQKTMEETKGLDDTGGLLDVDMVCMRELATSSDFDQCRPNTQVLYGNQVRIVCRLGYTNSTDATLQPTCTSDGSFSEHAGCDRRPCGIFMAGEHATSEVRLCHIFPPTSTICESSQICHHADCLVGGGANPRSASVARGWELRGL